MHKWVIEAYFHIRRCRLPLGAGTARNRRKKFEQKTTLHLNLSPFARTLLTLIGRSAIARPELNDLLSRDGLAHKPEKVALPTLCTADRLGPGSRSSAVPDGMAVAWSHRTIPPGRGRLVGPTADTRETEVSALVAAFDRERQLI